MACRWPWGGSDVAWGGFARAFDVGSWMLDVRCWVFFISISNTTRLSRRPGGGLGVPWYHRTPSNPFFDQPGLSNSLSNGVSTAEGSSKPDVLPPRTAF